MFTLIGVVVLMSFDRIEGLLTATVVRDVGRNLENAGLLRELSGVFTDTNLLAATFIKKEELLKARGAQLVATTEKLAAQSTNPHLRASLGKFALTLRAILEQCERINSIVRTQDEYDRRLHASLARLEKIISDKKIDLILKGFDPTIMEQLGNLTTGYQETLLEVNLLIAQAGFELRGSVGGQRTQPIVERLDELVPRLQTLTASEPAIAAYGPLLTTEVLAYKTSLTRFFQAVSVLQQRLGEMEVVKVQIIDGMKEVDGEIASSTNSMRDRIKEVMHSSRRFILMLAVGAVLLSAVFTFVFILSNIRRPMALIGDGIESIRGGNLDTHIRLNRRDEWGVIEEALNRMAADLKASYEALRDKNRDLETTQAALSEKVVELVTQVEARTRAEQKLARHQEHLEEMVQARTAELEAAQRELVQREKLAVLGRLTATVSHELRNPLGVIRSSAFYLARKLGREDEKIAKHLDRIEQQVALSDSIVGDLLEYTRGSLSEMSEGDLNAWLDEVLDHFTPPEGVCLSHELCSELPRICFDREKMRRVVVNLVENALHAVASRREHGGGEEYYPQVQLVTAVDGDGIRMVVADNGSGMDGETAARAFEPLFTTRARGTGLGLAIVRKIVEEHGGVVSLVSGIGSGTQVTVWLPADAQGRAVAT